MCILMRHGRRTPSIDSSLINFNSRDLDSSCPEIWKSIRSLVERGVTVREIVTSPYLRTRQTAAVVQHGYHKLTGKRLPIRVDVRLGEYNRRHTRLFTPDTTEFDKDTCAYYNGRLPLCRESPEALVQRVVQFSSSLSDDTIAITHYGIAELVGLLLQKEVKLGEGEFMLLPSASSQEATL